MPNLLNPLYRRFPGREAEIRELFASNNAFNSLCRTFCDLDARAVWLEGPAAVQQQGEREMLRRRRAALEEEMLAFLQQTQRA